MSKVEEVRFGENAVQYWTPANLGPSAFIDAPVPRFARRSIQHSLASRQQLGHRLQSTSVRFCPTLASLFSCSSAPSTFGSGCANRELRRASLTPFSVLNYGHLGVEVSLDSSKEGYTIRDRAFHNTTRVLVVKDTPSGPKVTSRRKLNFSGPKKDEPVERLFSWMPSVIWDHCELVSLSPSSSLPTWHRTRRLTFLLPHRTGV